MPHPYSYDAESRPWTCLRDGAPRALCNADFERCATCPRLEARTLDAAKRDIAYETWGVGIDLPDPTFDDARREIVWETFGLTV